MRATTVVSVLALAAIAACSSGCGSARNDVIVRVSVRTITRPMLYDQMSLIAPEHIVPDPPRYERCIAHAESLLPGSIRAQLKQECAERYRELKHRALDALISAIWLTSEASQSKITISEHEVDAKLKQSVRAGAGARLADLRLTTEAQLASSHLNSALTQRQRHVTQAQVQRYYAQNMRRYERPERRFFDIVEYLPDRHAAQAVLKTTKRRGRLSRNVIHEHLDRLDLGQVSAPKRAIVRAIFKAKPHVLTGPVILNGLYAVFEVTQIRPGTRKPLQAVEGSIESEIAARQQRRALVEFIAAWRARWRDRTDCSPGYVVQKCRQYRGPRTSEDPSTFS
jgi:PPIC-type PPIASE domain